MSIDNFAVMIKMEDMMHRFITFDTRSACINGNDLNETSIMFDVYVLRACLNFRWFTVSRHENGKG